MRRDLRLRGERQILTRVLAGEVRHGDEPAFTPKEFIGEGRNVAHVNPAANHHAALADRPERHRRQRPDRCEDDGCVQLVGRALLRGAGPDASKRSREFLGRCVSAPREGVDGLAVMHGELGEQVRRRPEAIEPKSLHRASVLGHAP